MLLPRILAWACLLLVPGSAHAGCEKASLARGSPALAESLQTIVDEARERIGAPALSVAVSMPDRGCWLGAAGDDVDADSRFRIGSVTKMFTAALVLQLAAEKGFDLEDPIVRHGAASWTELPPGAEAIRVRHLLNHTSGLASYTDSPWFPAAMILLSFRRFTPGETLWFSEGKELLFEPGQRHLYSNTNYVLLGLLAERVTGSSVGAELERRFFAPLGMDATSLEAATERKRLPVRGYDRDLIGLGDRFPIWMLPQAMLESTAWTAGSIVSSARDLALWLDALLGGEILEPRSLRAMTTVLKTGDPDVPLQTGYGLGLRELRMNGVRLLGHTGTFPGYTNAAFHVPSEDWTIVALSNLSSADVLSVIRDILTTLSETKSP